MPGTCRHCDGYLDCQYRDDQDDCWYEPDDYDGKDFGTAIVEEMRNQNNEL